jgi:hypothetical protein
LRKLFEVLLLLAGILWLDRLEGGTDLTQALASLLAWLYFARTFLESSHRLRTILILGLFVAGLGETLFSLFLGMYEYRTGSIPLYVFPGHCILFASVWHASHSSLFHSHRRQLERALTLATFSFVALWLFLKNDLYGALCALPLAYILFSRPRSRLFLLLMFWTVTYLELLGTYLGCWSWPPLAFARFEWLPSGNPPSAISVFYMAFDAACLKLYLRLHPHVLRRYRHWELRKAKLNFK